MATYRPIRASVRRILSSAISACNHSDFMRAAKQLGLWADGKIALPEGTEAVEMLSDIALFEPNQRGRRAFDTFLGGKALALEAADVELARRMSDAYFSLFRISALHEAAGVWLEDLLAGNRKLRLMDESMEKSALDERRFRHAHFRRGRISCRVRDRRAVRRRDDGVHDSERDAQWPHAVPSFARRHSLW